MTTKTKVTESATETVLVRTYSAGVHVGDLESRNGQEVTLTNARRIWSWNGANTLHEIANNGVGKGSRISEAVPSITLLQAIEILSVSDAAKAAIEKAGWSK